MLNEYCDELVAARLAELAKPPAHSDDDTDEEHGDDGTNTDRDFAEEIGDAADPESTEESWWD